MRRVALAILVTPLAAVIALGALTWFTALLIAGLLTRGAFQGPEIDATKYH